MSGRKGNAKNDGEAAEPYFNVLSYLLSRLAFLLTHVAFTYWLLYISNDPLNTGLVNTLDPKTPLSQARCNSFNTQNLLWDVALIWGLWWGSHSIMARKAYKVAVGLWQHPLERPMFAFIAPLTWGATLVLWKPVSDCESFDVFAVPLWRWGVSLVVFSAGAIQLLTLFYSLPDHVFGVDKYRFPPGQQPAGSGKIIEKIPYNLVRHPAAAGFIWMFWSWPSYTTNHIVLASLWTVFIVVGTLAFEEGGLRGPDEFGDRYKEYASRVYAFVPSLYSIKSLFGAQNAKKQR